MKIDHYSFGEITIGGKVYTSDVITYPEHLEASWWRREGRRLSMEDIAGAVDAKPEILKRDEGQQEKYRLYLLL